MFPIMAGNSASTGYNLTRSLRLRQSASAYLSRTFTSTGNRQIWTWSGWVKRGALSSGTLFGADGSNYAFMYFSPDSLDCGEVSGGSQQWRRITTQVFRDPSAWYHIVFAFDSTQATAGNRIKLYVNGAQVTAFSTSADPSLNYNSVVNTTIAHSIGSFAAPTRQAYLDGYLTEVNFIDGQALTPSSFGSTNALTGVWQPARYTGSYGTNGFYLPFTDNSALTTASNVGLGKDFSGNGNYWTTNNISIAPGSRQSFTSTGTTTWTAPAGVTSVQYLVVAGGGAGGGGGGAAFGGGGAGGMLVGSATVVPGNSYAITVGAGGVGTTGTGTNGGNSVFDSFATAIGGGFGGTFYTTVGNGGSGGGGFFNGGNAGTGTAGQGNAGGTSSNLINGGGGGGAGGAGGSYVPGAGLSSSLSGSAVVYAAGGYGGYDNGATPVNGAAGAANTGNGGGGAWGTGTPASGGNGGSGIVIVAWGGNTTYDSMTDVPTLTSATAANFAVLNPLDKYSTISMTGGNLDAICADVAWRSGAMTFGNFTTGKWYYEVTATNIGGSTYVSAGWELASLNHTTQANGVGAASGNNFGVLININTRQTKVNGSVFSSDSNTYANGAVLMIAVDFDAGKGWVGYNGTWFDSGNPSAGTSPCTTTVSGGMTPAYQMYNNGGLSANFGQRPFTYTPPTGFVALNTYNLPTSTILQGNKVMDATTYTGNASTNTIVNAGAFKPDLVWMKGRSINFNHAAYDSVRGVYKTLFPNLTNAEVNETIALTSFNSNGFTIGSEARTNDNGQTFVAWQWQAGQGSTSSNTNGNVTSTVSVNASAGFSVVTYTGTGANATVGHGLGVAPAFYVVKARNYSSGGNWVAWHTSLSQPNALWMNLTSAQVSYPTAFNSTNPTSSVLSLGTAPEVNNSGSSFVAYCWTPIAGYSAFGTYAGNGSTDGPFMYTGFRPKWVMIKCFGAAASWVILDSARDVYNPETNALLADSSAAEGSGYLVDFLSNGFKVRNTGSGTNSAGTGYIYAAFAENPFKNSLAR